MLPGERLVGGLWCSQVLADLSSYLDGELEASRRAQLEEHVQHCQVCAEFGSAFGGMLQSVRSGLSRPDSVPADVEARLHQALRISPA